MSKHRGQRRRYYLWQIGYFIRHIMHNMKLYAIETKVEVQDIIKELRNR